ncbi:sigma-70 family RNA polymerase sigma factor [Cytobacillus spongiae]|uniref:sigma-70 family RNA polymerase sigma factor n=1 Tax=Cytobacillus spongiae TaxID=2901381 RepID=UPI001F40C270|nr:sigma-70 family RNA polymerase sigma factor [Cytobacillus spongiae]UII57597.1 sigma-70 family RNA polymerase sigma factor [Cytobacillus spongiae]
MNRKEKQSFPPEPHDNEAILVWLMEEYGDMVIRLAFTYVKQKELAEDIAQEVFISCYKHAHSFKGNSSYQTWVYRITVNKCKDVLKSWSLKNIFYKEISKVLHFSPVIDEEDVEKLEEKEALFKEVLALPVKHREVLILHYYEDLSVHEIADLLKVNSNTVKTRLHRARAKLRGSLEKGAFSWKIN